MMQTGIRALPPGRDFSNYNNLAVLRYAGAQHGNPTVNPTVNVPVSKIPFIETNLHVSVVMVMTLVYDAYVLST
jgi:hypothetical protein